MSNSIGSSSNAQNHQPHPVNGGSDHSNGQIDQSKPMERELHQAAVSRNSDRLRELLDQRPERLSEVTWIDKNTVLHLATNSKRRDTVRIILEKEKQQQQQSDQLLIYKTNNKKETPLHLAARMGNTEIAELLLDAAAGTDKSDQDLIKKGQLLLVQVMNSKKDTALHLAAGYGHLEMVKMLLEVDEGLALSENEAGEGPLFCALNGKLFPETARHIMENVSDYSFGGRDGMNALHAAAMLTSPARVISFPDLLKKAMEKSGDLLVNDNKGLTPLHYAACCDNFEAVKAIMVTKPDSACLPDKEGKTPLHYAVSKNNSEAVTEIMGRQPDSASLADVKGKTPLHYAVSGGHLNAITAEIMEKKPETACKKDKEGNKTPLHYAVSGKNLEAVTTIIGKNPDSACLKDKEGKSPLHHAVSGGNLKIIYAIMEKNRMSGYVTDKEGKTSLNVAAEKGNVEVLKKYVELCPDAFEQIDSKGRNALHIAAQSKKKEAVLKFMVDTPGLESLIDARDNNGDTPLDCANKLQQPPKKQSEAQKTKDMERKLRQAVASGDLKLFKQLVEDKPERLNQVTLEEKYTVLHLAIISNQKEIVKMALDKMPSLLYKRKHGRETSLHLAAREGNIEIAEILLNAADTNGEAETLVRMVNYFNDTALHLAAAYGFLEIVKKLLEKDEGLASLENNAGEGCIFRALRKKKLATARHLLENSSENSFRGRNGMNVLHAAAMLESTGVLSFADLLEKAMAVNNGELVEQRDDLGLTPLHYAVEHNLEAVAAILEKHPGSGCLPDKEGKTPLHIAAEKGNIELLKKYAELCPDAFELTDSKSRSALHFAVNSGKTAAVNFILDMPGLESEFRLNKRDINGHVPKDYARKLQHGDIYRILEERYHRTYGSTDSFTKASRISKFRLVILGLFRKPLFMIERFAVKAIGSGSSSDPKEDPEAKRERKERLERIVQSNMVVGALIAAATFMAAIQAPGGVNDKGDPFLKHKFGYNIFYYTNILAFFFSILAVIMNFSATYQIDSGAPASFGGFIVKTGLCTFVSLVAMVVAFFTGSMITKSGYNDTPEEKSKHLAFYYNNREVGDVIVWTLFVITIATLLCYLFKVPAKLASKQKAD